MGFFEDFTLRAASLGESAANKTREIADITKLSIKISDEEKKLFGLFQSLGQSCFAAQENGEQKDFSEEIEAIRAQKALLASLEAEKAKLKKGRPCPQCGTIVDKEDGYCRKCGTKM